MQPFWIALFFIFVAEMGDKTQLVALAFATRYRAGLVLSAVLAATLAVHLGSVLLGEAAATFLPIFWIRILSGVAFLLFGLWTIRGDELEEEEKLAERRFGPFLTVAITFFLAEVGDKTMLATVTIASQQRAFVAVWLGSSLGMVLSDGLAILVGRTLGHRLPEKWIRYGAAVIFLVSGLVTIYGAFRTR